MNDLKVFTVEEATKLLPELTKMLTELQKLRDEVLGLEVEVDAIELIAHKDQDGYSAEIDQKLEQYHRSVERFYSLVDAIHAKGCFLKDLDLGLLDFYTIHHGKVVYLCWKLGETKISHWHDVGQGFAQRQSLSVEP